nr:MAG TPA: hypothetical protein [Caudoviricetes sp.]
MKFVFVIRFIYVDLFNVLFSDNKHCYNKSAAMIKIQIMKLYPSIVSSFLQNYCLLFNFQSTKACILFRRTQCTPVL